MMMKYEFKEQDAYDFARKIGARTRSHGRELFFMECPYCHSKKDKETFSINLENGQYSCFRSSCGASGNFVTLARDFNFSLGADFDRYYSNKNQFRKFGVKKVESTDVAVRYMKNRGISESTTKKYEISSHNQYKNIVVFPFFDAEEKLRFIKYRKTDYDKSKDKNKEWCEVNCMPILFGMKQCNDKFDRLVICEGQMDSLSVAESGIENAVSVPNGAKGFTWVPYCWEWFSKFEELVVFGDYENGKITLLEELRKRFPGRVKYVKESNYKGCKDANEILLKFGADQVKKCVNDAISVPVKRVKDLSDVEAVDLYSIPRIPTGIYKLDKILSGGIYAGQVVLLTGKRGQGKSTLASQIMANTIRRWKTTFSYSGELQDFFFKRWLDFQIAGRNNIIENERVEGIKTYLITNSKQESINEWYRGRAYIYENDIPEDDELEDVLATVEQSVMQYGIDLVLIDNLMTALDVGMGVDLYRAQSKFVGRLSRMAKRLEVAVILVAHPRKNKFGGDENDEVSGSADIANKVDIIMTYKKDGDLGEDERYLSVSKNRLTGKTTDGKGILLYYDDKSKRISDNKRFFDEEFEWKGEYEDEDGFTEIESEEETPFT